MDFFKDLMQLLHVVCCSWKPIFNSLGALNDCADDLSHDCLASMES